MQNLADYSGRSGSLRIGGNTQDNIIYQQEMNDFAVKRNPNPVGQGDYASDMYIIGPCYFEAINRFPNNTPITFGLNMAYYEADYTDQLITITSAAVKKLTSLDLIAFEIDNEPDLYLGNHLRNNSWTEHNCVSEWKARAQAIYERVLQPANRPPDFFEGPCSASIIGTTFEIFQLVADGIQVVNDDDVRPRTGVTTPNTNNNLPYLRVWNQHDYPYFIGVSEMPLTLSWVTDLDNTDTQLAYWAAQVRVALAGGLPYHLREMACVGPVGSLGISDTFGATLWTLNLFMYAAALNISSLQIHMTDDSLAAPWQPGGREGVAKSVRPSYYAFTAMAQLVGSGNGIAQVAPLMSEGGVPSGYKGNVRMYAWYGGGGGVDVCCCHQLEAGERIGDRQG